MMGRRKDGQGQFFYAFDLEQVVPPDHLVRQIDGVLDLSWVHKELASYYSHTGRPSIDPVLMIRMLIVGYVFAIRSERRICAEVQVNLAYRWFCKLGIEDRIRIVSLQLRGLGRWFVDRDRRKRTGVRDLQCPVGETPTLLDTGSRGSSTSGVRLIELRIETHCPGSLGADPDGDLTAAAETAAAAHHPSPNTPKIMASNPDRLTAATSAIGTSETCGDDDRRSAAEAIRTLSGHRPGTKSDPSRTSLDHLTPFEELNRQLNFIDEERFFISDTFSENLFVAK
jgi:hypothetical protein